MGDGRTIAVTASFDYQIKGRQSPEASDLLAVHPLCYERFNMSVNTGAIVFPHPFEHHEVDALAPLGVDIP
jgi:hypothetical protein